MSDWKITHLPLDGPLHPLHHHYDENQTQPQEAYIRIGWLDRTIHADYDGETAALPWLLSYDNLVERVWIGGGDDRQIAATRCTVPYDATAEELNRLLNQIGARVATAGAVATDNYLESVFEGLIRALFEDIESEEPRIYTAEEWYEPWPEGDLPVVAPDSTDEHLDTLAVEIERDARKNGVTVTGVDEWLAERRAETTDCCAVEDSPYGLFGLRPTLTVQGLPVYTVEQ